MHGHFGHEIHLDTKLGGLLRKDHTCQIIRLRILLPVDEMLTGHNAHGVAENASTRMRARPQANDLWPQINGTIIAIVGNVIEGDVDRHRAAPARSLGHSSLRKSCAKKVRRRHPDSDGVPFTVAPQGSVSNAWGAFPSNCRHAAIPDGRLRRWF